MVDPDLVGAAIEAGVVGILLVLAIIGLAWRYGDDISTLTKNVEQVNNSVTRIQDDVRNVEQVRNSVEKIEDDVRAVDLKEMEKVVMRLEYALGTEKESGNSVYKELENSGIGVTISLLADPHEDLIDPIEVIKYSQLTGFFEGTSDDLELEPGEESKLSDFDDLAGVEDIEPEAESTEVKKRVEAGLSDDEITYVMIEFDEKIRSRAVSDKLADDEELEEMELDMFGYECGFTAISPIEIQFSVPTANYDEAGEWLDIALQKIDRYHMEFERESELFDEEVEQMLS